MPISDLFPWGNSKTIREAGKRTNANWIAMLHGSRKEQALAELRLILVRGLQFGLRRSLKRNAGELIEDFVQDALVKILDNLDSFRGESKFTTWAQKIAMRVAFSELRRKRWEDVSLDELSESTNGNRQTPVPILDTAIATDDHLSQKLNVQLVYNIIENDLTERQRNAMYAVFVQGMPMEEVARKMGTNRNALYKLLHDARKRVQFVLQEQGISADDILSEL